MLCTRRRGINKVLETTKPIPQPLKRADQWGHGLKNLGSSEACYHSVCSQSTFHVPDHLIYTQVASDHVETFEKLTLFLQCITTSLERYNNYETLFRSHVKMQKATGALDADLLDLCSRVVRFYSPFYR